MVPIKVLPKVVLILATRDICKNRKQNIMYYKNIQFISKKEKYISLMHSIFLEKKNENYFSQSLFIIELN